MNGSNVLATGLRFPEGPVVLRDVPKADLVQAALHDLGERSQALARSQHEPQQEESALADETRVWGRR